tara:strand:+ start:10356 stop:10979 length:624 start_codon:yes stop_codon:yes gene_type:complete
MRINVLLNDKSLKLVSDLAKKRNRKAKKFGAGRYPALSKRASDPFALNGPKKSDPFDLNRKKKDPFDLTEPNHVESEWTHKLGLIGEVAVAQYFGVSIDENIYDDHGDDGTDLVIPELGGRVDVKTTPYCHDPYLRVPMGKPKDKEKMKNVDAYVSCCYDKSKPNMVQIIGWQKKEIVIKSEKKRFLDQGPLNYKLEEHELEQIPSK